MFCWFEVVLCVLRAQIERIRKKTQQMVTLDELNTGDLLFFAGKGCVSDGIRCWGSSPYSHTAIVSRLRNGEDATLGEGVYAVECNTRLNAALECRGSGGPQILDLKVRLRDYWGRIDVRQLVVNDNSNETVDYGDLNKRLLQFTRDHLNWNYCADLGYWLKTRYSRNDIRCSNGDFYCVNFVGYALWEMGLLDVGGKFSNDETPKESGYELVET